ncbi:agmatinase [Massilia sp. W12]|uniref:agmatinase n=1 Tax=Massilia sp. W12 TaxID=3126507 RepID=UPI0030D464E3
MSQHEFAFLSHMPFASCAMRTAQTGLPFCIAGLAWDGAVTNRPGARFGPQAIRSASHMLCDAIHPFFDVGLQGFVADAGDLRLPNTSLSEFRAALEAQAPALLAKHHMVWLGGDHSVTLSLLRALYKKHGRLAVLHFDAHCDTWTDHFGEPSGHGTWVYEALQEGLLAPQATMQIGIRSSGERAAREYVNSVGGRVFTARELRGLESPAQLQGVIQEIRQRVQAQGLPLYLSLDIDCLDPAFAPGTGTPEPGGLSTNQVLSLLEELADLPWCGMDCVEVAPPYDHAELTSQAAAAFVWTYLAGRISHMRGHR